MLPNINLQIRAHLQKWHMVVQCFSCSNILCSYTYATNYLSVGNNSFEGLLCLDPNVVSQICFAYTQTAVDCLNRYHHQQYPSSYLCYFQCSWQKLVVWYPDSTRTSYMILCEGNLLSKSIYKGTDGAWVGNGTLLPKKQIGSPTVSTYTQPLSLIMFFLCHP